MSTSSPPNSSPKSAKSRLYGETDLPLSTPKPKSMFRPNLWNEEVEEAYRFQLAGYKDEVEYKALQGGQHADRWPHNNFIKKLRRRSDGFFYYYNKTRECSDKDINKTKIYVY